MPKIVNTNKNFIKILKGIKNIEIIINNKKAPTILKFIHTYIGGKLYYFIIKLNLPVTGTVIRLPEQSATRPQHYTETKITVLSISDINLFNLQGIITVKDTIDNISQTYKGLQIN